MSFLIYELRSTERNSCLVLYYFIHLSIILKEFRVIAEISDSKTLLSNDNIINGGLLPLSEKELSFKCESSGEQDDSLVSSSFNSEANTYCSNSKREKLATSNRANGLRDEILKQEELYLSKLVAEDGSSKQEGNYEDCSPYIKLIYKDLEPFRSGITQDMLDEASARGILYQVLGGRLYRQRDCNFPNRCSGIEHFLVDIAKNLPDTEFVVNISDWPQIPAWSRRVVPIFSFSKTSDYADITYPAWTFWEGGPSISIYPKGIGRWDLIRKSLISTSKKIRWNDKQPVAFFRGSRTSNERDSLILLSRKNPHLVDAQYTKNQAWKSDRDTLNAPAVTEVSFEGHCAYKYLFNYRGVAASFRFKHLFLCNSLVFHVGDDWMEFFYSALIPWIHYIPVEKFAKEEDLRFLIQFFQANDDIAARIAARGYDFIARNLKLSHVFCYWRELLTSYTKYITYNVQTRGDMILVS